MKSILFLPLVLLFTVPLMAQDINTCDDRINEKLAVQNQTEQQYKQGLTTCDAVADRRLESSDVVWDCHRATKRNYCHFQLDNLEYKLSCLEDRKKQGAKVDKMITQTQERLNSKLEFCRKL